MEFYYLLSYLRQTKRQKMKINSTNRLATNASSTHIDMFGTQKSKDYEYDNHKDMVKVVETLNGKIKYLTDIKFCGVIQYNVDIRGKIIINGKNDFTIFLDENRTKEEINFTIAHEIGHYILHSREGRYQSEFDRELVSTASTDRLEWEANWFAAGFLMPKVEFKDIFEKFQKDFSKIAKHFKVSIRDSGIRANYLALI